MPLAGFVNAFNFMDGINGISGARAAIAGMVYAALGASLHDVFLPGGRRDAGAWNSCGCRHCM